MSLNNGFQLVTRPRKRRVHDEPDPSLILQGKRTRIDSERVLKMRNSEPAGKNAHSINRFEALDNASESDDTGDNENSDDVNSNAIHDGDHQTESGSSIDSSDSSEESRDVSNSEVRHYNRQLCIKGMLIRNVVATSSAKKDCSSAAET